MKRTLIIGLLIIIGLVSAFFIYEGVKFNHYISSSEKGHSGDMNIPINHEAPVKSDAEMMIEAPMDRVWTILTSINDWPDWQSDVTESHLTGELVEGAAFNWKAGGLSFSSQIHTVDRQVGLGWTGKTFGASAVHNWYFTDEGDRTLIRVEESLQGVFPSLFKAYFQKNLDSGVRKNLVELKNASERK